MALIKRHSGRGRCQSCGQSRRNTVDIHFPRNAEYDRTLTERGLLCLHCARSALSVLEGSIGDSPNLRITRHQYPDWCHVCGNRVEQLAVFPADRSELAPMMLDPLYRACLRCIGQMMEAAAAQSGPEIYTPSCRHVKTLPAPRGVACRTRQARR